MISAYWGGALLLLGFVLGLILGDFIDILEIKAEIKEKCASINSSCSCKKG